MTEKKNAKFASKWGFILASVGSAVGMANVWGFPAKMGAYGGSAFLIAYLLFVALFGIVGLSAEYAIGRRSRTGTLGSYQNAWATRNDKLGKAGGLLGWLPLAGSMCIAIGYAIIVAYVLKAFFHSITGELMHVDTEAWFGTFSTTEFSVVPFHVIVVIGTLLTLLLGARSIEKTNKIMMPVFFIIFVILAVRVAMLPGAMETLRTLKEKGVRIAIGSSSRNTPIILKQIQLTDTFDAVADGNAISRSKPDPEVFLLAAQLLNLSPENCLVVEDADAGVEAALAGGMRVLGVGGAAQNPKATFAAESLAAVDLNTILM